MHQGVRWFKRRFASVGDVIVITVKDAIPRGKVKKEKSTRQSSLELQRGL